MANQYSRSLLNRSELHSADRTYSDVIFNDDLEEFKEEMLSDMYTNVQKVFQVP